MFDLTIDTSYFQYVIGIETAVRGPVSIHLTGSSAHVDRNAEQIITRAKYSGLFVTC